MSQSFRMLTAIASVEGWSYKLGQTVQAGDDYTESTVLEATLRGWVRAGIAEPVPEQHPVEAAVLPMPETATMPGPVPREAVIPETIAPAKRAKRR